VLAALDGLLQAMQVNPPSAAQASARTRFKVDNAPLTDSPSMREPK
jgi:hypothetical protein